MIEASEITKNLWQGSVPEPGEYVAEAGFDVLVLSAREYQRSSIYYPGVQVLHAPNDDIRRQLIPWAQYAPIDELLDACGEYFALTGREITLEYLLLRRVNDRIEHAEELARLARRLRSNVNLIRYN